MYLERNQDYWKRGYKGYPDENVESFVFRPYGRIIERELGKNWSSPKTLLDFGCGAGMPSLFFRSKGFDVYGVDISEANIRCCRERMPDVANHFNLVDPKPELSRVFEGGPFDVVVALQSLYYFSDSDLKIALQNLYQQMKPGALIYATMIGKQCWCYDHSVEFQDGLRKFEVANNRSQIDYHYVNFTNDEADLIKKFGMFKKLHVGFHSERYREDEGTDFHFTFVGKKEG
jgi:SAM-dependent methyltransferase